MSAARIGGGIAAAVLAALLIWFAAATTGPAPVVMPKVAINASGEGQAGKGNTPWTDRSKLMGDRQDPGTIAGVNVPTAAETDKTVTKQERVSNPKQLIESWRLTNEMRGILNDPAMHVGVTSVPYGNLNVLEQPQGRDWRRSRNETMMHTGGWLILGISLALALFLFARGRIHIAEGESSETVPRFGPLERANHWMTASAFVILALTGLLILYGKPLIEPWLGHDTFGNVALVSVWLHMAAAVPLTIGIIVMVALWLRENIPSRLDWEWLKRGGGFVSDSPDKPLARKFNAGQKAVFWGVVIGGLLALISGLMLMFPFFWLGYTGMQWAQLSHAAIGLLLIALIIGHIYIGTVGMQGAIDAMWSGRVDRNWAKEHHKLWYDDLVKQPGAVRRDPGHPAQAAE